MHRRYLNHHHLRSTHAADNRIELSQDLVAFLESLLPLRFGSLQILLELLDVLFLIFFAAIKTGQSRTEDLDLLLFQDQVPRELDHARLKIVGWEWIDFAELGIYASIKVLGAYLRQHVLSTIQQPCRLGADGPNRGVR